MHPFYCSNLQNSQCRWFTKYIACNFSKLTVFILPNTRQTTTIEKLDLMRSLSLGGGVQEGGASLIQKLLRCCCTSSRMLLIQLGHILNGLLILFKKHNSIYFLHILFDYVNVQVGECWP